MKNSFRILIITILSVVLISCRTVKAQCGFSLMRDTVTKMDVYQLLMSFLVIQVVEVLCYSMWESIIAYLKMMCKVHSI